MYFEVLDTWMIITVSSILGLLIGSFLNVVIYRTPVVLNTNWTSECKTFLEIEPDKDPTSEKHFSILWPPSSCPSCNTIIKPWQNIPVISYLFLKGKCSGCATSISIRYPLVEILTAILTALVATQFGLTLTGLSVMFFTWALIALTGIDFDTQLLPDNIVLPLLWLGLIVNSFNSFTSLNDAVWGAIAGYIVLWSVFWLFKLITGKEGMGYGDFKLLGALGAWMGWQLLTTVILIASITGLIAAVLMMVFLSHDRRVPIAFGPYLAIGGWVSFMYNEQIAALAPFLRVF